MTRVLTVVLGLLVTCIMVPIVWAVSVVVDCVNYFRRD